ncbi:MAG: response regulator transcription factor [Gemmatimonadaceae bacterium]
MTLPPRTSSSSSVGRDQSNGDISFPSRTQRVLVVEDNEPLAYGLRNSLEIAGFEVLVAADGLQGLEMARSLAPDLVILDLMLPVMDGYQVLRTLRDEANEVPVLILTARGEEPDKVLGFRLGADDYVTKPFGLLELLARIEARLRPRGHNAAHSPADAWESFDDIELNVPLRMVKRHGQEVDLSPKEFALLVTLVRKEGAVISRMELLKAVWGYSAAVESRTVDTHVALLRRKLEDDPTQPRHIVTVWKMGYRFVR